VSRVWALDDQLWEDEMNVSDAGLALIREHEGCQLEAYQDSVGVWTIGYGHTRGVKRGDTCTQEQADAWLVEDVGSAENCVNNAVTVEMTQGEFDALVSFTFNLGCAALRNSTLLRKLNADDRDGAAAEFHKWNHAGGVALAGLTARRAAEAEMFETA
jgi:lysozyme